MKYSINSRFAAAMLITLAITGPVAAAQPSDTTDIDNTALYEEQQAGQAAEDEANASPSEVEQQMQVAEEEESQTLAVSAAEDATSENVSEAKTAEENDTLVAQTTRPSENMTFKNEMKHALLGLLLPAVERRVRKAVNSDDHASQP